MAILRGGLLALLVLVAATAALVAVRLCRPAGPIAGTLARLLCRASLRLLRIRIVVSGSPPPHGSGRMLVANHLSWIDPLVLLAITPAAVLAKREVGTWPAIGALARLQATVFVDRGRRREIPKVNRTLARRIAQGHTVLLFPEGTTHDGQRRGRFLTSHLACLAEVMAQDPARRTATVQAAALRYSDRAAAWVGDATLLPHLWLMMRNPGMTCHVAFEAPRTVTAGFDRKSLGRDLAADVERLLACRIPARPPLEGWIKRREPGLIVTRP